MIILILISPPQIFAAGISVEPSVSTSNGERLIARSVIYTKAIWCGNDNLVLDTEKSGPILYSLIKNLKRKILNGGNFGATSCSPNGRWLIAVDADSGRYDRDYEGHEDYEHGVKNFWMVDLDSNNKERLAIAQGGGKWSPDGTKILFIGKIPQLFVKQPILHWDFYWSHDWPSGSGGIAAWMPDSSNILLGHREKFYLQYGQDLSELEMVSPQGLIDGDNFSVDGQGLVYVSGTSTKNPAMRYQLARCSINSVQMNCIRIASTSAGVITFDVSRDGRQLVYLDPANSNLYLVDLANKQPKLIARNVEGYPSISPDGKKVVFYRLRDGNTEGMGFDSHNAFIMLLE